MKLVGISVLAVVCLLVAGVTCNYGGYYPVTPQRNQGGWWGLLPLLFLLILLPLFSQSNDQLVLVNSTLV